MALLPDPKVQELDAIQRVIRAGARDELVEFDDHTTKHHVYVVLLRDPGRPDPFGLYVGQTSRDPDLRFDQHKAGYKASGPVRRSGVSLLPELVEHLNPQRQWESLDLEAALAEALREVRIPWVEGDR